ncbi:MAG: hypothetical protein L3J84_11880 [Gammaproteobacteria bacterium]|nr:hypothetical protein [Gammaproteobacteria bacterium]
MLSGIFLPEKREDFAIAFDHFSVEQRCSVLGLWRAGCDFLDKIPEIFAGIMRIIRLSSLTDIPDV